MHSMSEQRIPKLLRMDDIVEISGFTKAHIYNQIKAGRLPKPIKIGRSSRWRESDVSAWILSYIDKGALR